MVDAMAALRRALELLAGLPATKERTRRELRAQAALGRALITTHGQAAPETGQAFDAALALAGQLEDTEEVFGILAGIFVYRMVRANMANALAIAERMLTAAQTNGGEVATLMAHRCVGVVRFYLGDHVKASYSLERAIELYRDDEHAPLAQRFAYDPKAAALAYLGICLLVQGRGEEARARLAQALAHAQALGHLVTWANTLAHVGVGHMVAGDEAAVRETAEALSLIAAEQGFPYWEAHAAIQRAWLHLTSTVTRPLSARRSSAIAPAETVWSCRRCWQSKRQGTSVVTTSKRGKALLEEAKQLSAQTGERWYEPEILRLSGEASAAMGCREEAESELRQAAEFAQRQGAHLWCWRAQTSLNRFLASRPALDHNRNGLRL